MSDGRLCEFCRECPAMRRRCADCGGSYTEIVCAECADEPTRAQCPECYRGACEAADGAGEEY